MNNKQLNSTLIEALEHSELELGADFIDDLIERGADVNHEEDGQSPLTAAISMKNLEGVKLLHRKGAVIKDEHLMVAALNNRLEIAKFLAERGALVHPTPAGTALHEAARHGEREMMSLLLDCAGGKIYIDGFDDLGRTPLMIVVKENNIAMSKQLLEAGANVNALDLDRIGQTALKSAVDNKNADLVALLLSHRADPFLASPGRPSPWDVAKKFEREPHLRIKTLILPLVPSHLKGSH